MRKGLAGLQLLLAAGFSLAAPLLLADDSPAAPTAPFVTGTDKINSGDTAWMLASTALVLMMTIPGLALFYAGMVRKKNVLATMAQTFAATALCSVLWMVIGYSLTFTGAGPVIGTLERVMLRDIGMDTVSPFAPTIPEALYAIYQMTFAVITVALVAGFRFCEQGHLIVIAAAVPAGAR
jgi:ammonium transporter, Amt family